MRLVSKDRVHLLLRALCVLCGEMLQIGGITTQKKVIMAHVEDEDVDQRQETLIKPLLLKKRF